MTTVRSYIDSPIQLLSSLIALDYDAIDAYEAAIDRLRDSGDRDQLRGFMMDHVRHTYDLGVIVRRSGARPPTKGDYKRVLTRGRIVLAGLFDDRAILFAMKANESTTVQAYTRALDHQDITQEIAALLLRNLGDEQRHKAWLAERLESYAHVSRLA